MGAAQGSRRGGKRPTARGAMVALLPVATLAVGLVIPDVAFEALAGADRLAPTFADAANITSAVECSDRGYDTLVANPCDPFGRPMNYPRIWVSALGAISAGMDDTLWLGLGILAVFCAGVYALARTIRDAASTVIWVAMVLSPPVMLLLERGNNDSVVFAALAWSALGGGALAWVAATVVKIYPVVAFPVVWRHRPRREALLAVTAVTVVLLASAGDILAVSHAVPQHAVRGTYGAAVVPRFFGTVGTDGLWSLLGVVVVIAGWAAGRSRTSLGGTHVHLIQIAAVMYAATFLAGVNYTYRLVLLLMAVPQLLEWKEQGRREGVAGIALVVGVLWSTGTIWPRLILMWAVLAAAAYVVGATGRALAGRSDGLADTHLGEVDLRTGVGKRQS